MAQYDEEGNPIQPASARSTPLLRADNARASRRRTAEDDRLEAQRQRIMTSKANDEARAKANNQSGISSASTWNNRFPGGGGVTLPRERPPLTPAPQPAAAAAPPRPSLAPATPRAPAAPIPEATQEQAEAAVNKPWSNRTPITRTTGRIGDETGDRTEEFAEPARPPIPMAAPPIQTTPLAGAAPSRSAMLRTSPALAPAPMSLVNERPAPAATPPAPTVSTPPAGAAPKPPLPATAGARPPITPAATAPAATPANGEPPRPPDTEDTRYTPNYGTGAQTGKIVGYTPIPRTDSKIRKGIRNTINTAALRSKNAVKALAGINPY